MKFQMASTGRTYFAKLLRSIAASKSFRSAFFSFVLTRAIVLGCLVLAASARPEEPVSPTSTIEASIYVRQRAILRWLGEAVTTADANWYMDIARNGYDKVPFDASRQRNWAFFPLYPSIVRVAARLTGEFSITAAILSNIFFLVALVVIHKTALLFDPDIESANLAVFYLAAFPTAYFFSFPWTESLFLLLTVSAFFFAKKEKWWLAGACGALASATRFAGIFLWLPLIVLYLETYRLRLRSQLLALSLIPVGLLAFMLYLHSITGNAVAFYGIQSAWGREPTFFLQPLWSYLRNPWLLGAPWNFRVLNFASVVLALACLPVLFRRRQWALGLYTLISLVVPLSAGLEMLSLSRFVGVVFPVFLVLGRAGRSPTIDRIITIVFVVLLGLLTTMFARRVSMALT
jgi:Gpi18-like mannosyltransferase